MIGLLKLKSQTESQKNSASKAKSHLFATETRAEDRKKTADPPRRARSRGRVGSVANATSFMSPKIPYADLILALLEDQLSQHINFLAKFLQLFKEIDSDIDGIISC